MKLVILDRDGVINLDSDQYIKSPAEWRPIPGCIEAIARLTRTATASPWRPTSRASARGLFDMATLNAINDKMMELVFRQGGRIDALFFCPHAADETARCRKPQPGMLEEIAPRFHTELKGVPMVGRQPEGPAGGRGGGRAADAGAHRQGRGDAAATAALPRRTLVFADLARRRPQPRAA